MKYAKIVMKEVGTRWELRAGRKGTGRLLGACTDINWNQPSSLEFASFRLVECAAKQGYKIFYEGYDGDF